ncbi:MULTISPECIES: hypothetical protein [unclassified Variovorax]|uniref:hypothetical protein n=1 Tax=unclassified Variovorax TaxID=663243 RepID=UPI001BD6A6EF|nr:MULTISPECIES: hypothetical protein [unclassified Variovorax]
MPKKTVHVALDWHRIDWMPHETWKQDIVPKLTALGITLQKLRRCLYVIRLDGDFCIDYPRGATPTLYIGEGNFNQRIGQHRKWARSLENLVGDFAFQVCIAIPRVQGNDEAYRDAEAALIDFFAKTYGTTPLWNKQYETRLCPHYEYSAQSMKEAINKRSGARYQWALRPLKSTPFHRYYEQPPRA